VKNQVSRELDVISAAMTSYIKGVMIIDNEGKILYVNTAFLRLFGFRSKAEVIGRSVDELAPKELTQILLKREEILRRKDKKSEDFLVYEKDDSKIYIKTIFSVVVNQKGIKIGHMVVFDDITELKQLELALKDAEKFGESIVATIREPLLVLDANLRVVFANRAFYQTFQVTPKDTEGKLIYDLGNRQWDIPELRELLEKILPENTSFDNYRVEYDFEFIGKRVMLLNARRIYHNNHITRLILLAIEDITERVKIENALKESEEKIRKAYNRAEFYKDLLSHDISNILQSISLTIGVILSDPNITREQKDDMKIIDTQIERGAKLIATIQKLSKLEESPVKLESIELCGILKQAIKFIQNSFKEKDIKIKVITQNEKIFVMANSFLLDVFENLLHNTVKFNINFVIEISIRILSVQIEGKNYIQLEFSDNGIGISDDRKESIFQRADQENKSVHGMGKGLSLVKKIITSYKGSIWVEDRIPGDYSQGSIFFLQIPEKC